MGLELALSIEGVVDQVGSRQLVPETPAAAATPRSSGWCEAAVRRQKAAHEGVLAAVARRVHGVGGVEHGQVLDAATRPSLSRRIKKPS